MQGDEAGARQHLNNVRFDQRVQYSSDATGFPDSVATGTDLHLQILEEKYIALIGEIVTFHDLRRTRNAIGVPNKQGAIGASNFHKDIYILKVNWTQTLIFLHHCQISLIQQMHYLLVIKSINLFI